MSDTTEKQPSASADSDYHKKYYLAHKGTCDLRNKIAYCKRVYGVVFTLDDIKALGADYKIAARFYQDNEKLKTHHPDYHDKIISGQSLGIK